MFRKYLFKRFHIQKVLYSEGSIFRRSYVQKVLCSEGLMFRRKCSKSPIFRRLYVQKVLYSDIFRRSYIQKSLFFYVEKNLHLSVSGKLQCKITNHRLSFELIRSGELLSWRVVRRLSVHSLLKSILGLQST